jgi:hypothetical protein
MNRRLVPLLGLPALLFPVGLKAQTEPVRLAGALSHTTISSTESLSAYAEALIQRRRGRRAASTVNPIAFRLGAAFGDSSGLLLGLDLGVPSISIGAEWTGRVDFDVWALGGDHTNVGIILDQIMSSDGKTYLGFGLGIVAGDEGGLGIKLLIGTSISDRADLEFNAIFSDGVTPAIVARIHM